MQRKIALFLSATLLAAAAFAQPSLYYLWKNKKTGEQICDPQAADDSWVKVSGPYSDPNCKVPEKQ
jgi:hypothetical protein